MRPIKFRAWDYQNKAMTDKVAVAGNGHVTTWINDSLGVMLSSVKWEVMQFTGLTDKNGKEIYEGDIVSGWKRGTDTSRAYTGVLEWNQQECGYLIRCGKYLMEILSLAMSGDGETTRLDSFEVVGNIYEHPSLLNNHK